MSKDIHHCGHGEDVQVVSSTVREELVGVQTWYMKDRNGQVQYLNWDTF